MTNSLSYMVFNAVILSAVSSDLDPAFYLKSVGLDRQALGNKTRRLPLASEIAFWDWAVTESGSDEIAFRLGANTAFGTIPVLDFMGNSCDKVLDTLLMFRRYISLVHLIWHPNLYTTDSEIRFTLVQTESDPSLNYSLEYCLAAIWGRMSHLADQPIKLEAVHFRHPRAPSSFANNFFGCEVTFGQRTNSLILSSDTAEVRCKTPDVMLLKHMTGLADSLIEKLTVHTRSQNALSFQTSEVIREHLGENSIDIAVVAKAMGLSKRSLQRGLTAQATTYRQVLERVRSEEYAQLKHTFDNDGEIADALGYGSVSAFRRAQKSWS